MDNKFSRISDGNMNFLLCAPKEENEVEKEDDNFFFQFLKEKMRTRFEMRNRLIK